MYADLFQDWTTLSGDETTTSIIQSELKWGDFERYSDIILYTECKLLVKGGADQLKIFYETAPSKDESLFGTLAAVTLTLNQTIVTPILLSQGPSIPLSRWARWRLAPDGVAPTEAWMAVFRIHIAANAVGVLR